MDPVREQRLTCALATLAGFLTNYVTGDWEVQRIAGELQEQITAALYAGEELDPASAQGRLWAARMREVTGEQLLHLEHALAELRLEL